MRRVLFVCSSLILWTACGGESPLAPLADSGPNITDGSVPDGGGDENNGRADVSETILDFGTVVLDTSVTRTVTLTNNSMEPAHVSVSEISGRDAVQFMLTPFAEQDLAPGASAELTITMNASLQGPAFATIVVLACEDGCPVAISLIADVKLSAIVCETVFDFGVVAPGVCATGSVECMNNGNVEATIPSATLDALGAPEFQLNVTIFPLVLAAGETGQIELAFCPETVGDFVGRLYVLDQSIDLRGHGGGGSISCEPNPLDFGTIGGNTSTRRTLTCSNSGFEAIAIADVAVFTQDFVVLGPLSALINPGEFVNIEVEANPSGTGMLTDTLIVSSNDPESPELVIDVLANAVDVGPCDAVLTPPTVDFGLVAIGDSRSGAIAVENIGSSACLVGATNAAPRGGISFSFVPGAGTSIDPGQSISFRFVFEPTQAGTSSATIGLTFVNPNAMPLSGTILGTGGSVDLAISPSSLDFGSVAVGCAQPATQTITLQNANNAPLTITQIELVSTTSSGFALANVPATPLTLPFLTTADVSVSFAPPAPGNASAELRITVMGALAPIIVPISGSGEGTAARVDVVSLAPEQLDILFMIDNSASMEISQAALAEAMPRFVSRLLARGVDFHVGVITSDMIDPAQSGILQGTPAVIDAATPDVANVIASRVITGIDGDGTQESGVAAFVGAITPPLSQNENAGFLRPDARLVLIAMTDEDDQSGLDMEAAAVELRSAAGDGGVSLFAIVGPSAPPGCTGPQDFASPSPRWAELTARLGGTRFSYCDPLAGIIDSIGDQLFEISRVALSVDPVPETITVSQNGSPLASADWRYERVTNSVVLTATASLGSGDLEISFDAYCLSPTCGDGTTDLFESCDDANMSDDDNCTAGCRLAICGDGFTSMGNEGCDDANLSNADTCLNICAAASCGDGFLNAGVEECDDGNTTSGDGCPANCVIQRDLTGFYTTPGLTTATFTPITIETPVVLVGGDDDGTGTITLPFAFNFFGVPATSIDVSPNGLIGAVGLVSGTAFDNVSFPEAPDPDGIVAAWWEDLFIDNAVTGGASLSYEVQGTAPDQVLVVQWRGVRLAGHTTANHRRFTFQIALFETSNVIEIRFGATATSGAAPTATTASCGIENHDATVGAELLLCTPTCAGPARPGNPNGFPGGAMIRLTP